MTTLAHMEQSARKANNPNVFFFIQKWARWWALCKMSLCKRLTWLFKATFLNFMYSILPSFMSSTKTLWWTNSKMLFTIYTISHHTLEGMQTSSLNFLHETIDPSKDSHPTPNKPLTFLFNTTNLVIFPFTTIWKCLGFNALALFTEHNLAIHSSSINFHKFTRQAMSILVPLTRNCDRNHKIF